MAASRRIYSFYSAARCHKRAVALIARSDLIGTTPSRRIAASALTLVSVEVRLSLETLNSLRRFVYLSSGALDSRSPDPDFFFKIYIQKRPFLHHVLAELRGKSDGRWQLSG